MNELYNNEILKLAVSLPRAVRLANPDFTITKTSRICGSRVTVDLNFKDGRVAEYAQEVKACALGQATCSVVGRQVIGRRRPEIEKVAAEMRDMLAGSGEGPAGDWATLQVLKPARDHKSRHTSIMLSFEAILEGFRLADAEATAKTG
jgi:NifU-like protein involved in Fe-S cluster formation